jgi:hypothetical protein
MEGAGEPVCKVGCERVLRVEVVAECVEMGYVGRFEVCQGRWWWSWG